MCYSENITIPCELTGRMVHGLVYFVQEQTSGVYFAVGDRTVNAKSIIGVLSLGLGQNSEVAVSVINDDDKVGEYEMLKIRQYVRGLGDG